MIAPDAQKREALAARRASKDAALISA